MILHIRIVEYTNKNNPKRIHWRWGLSENPRRTNSMKVVVFDFSVLLFSPSADVGNYRLLILSHLEQY
jgi:hypothetical protein